jgi:hypothetical protein
MLNIHLTPEIPEPDEFDLETFTEICRYREHIRFLIKSDKSDESDERIGTLTNWRKFLNKIEDQLADGNLLLLWNKGPATASSIGEIPKNSIAFLKLVCMNPTQMYKELIPKIGNFDPIESAGALFDELNPYSVAANNITIFDRYLIKLERSFINKKSKNKRSKIHQVSLRKLALICRAISSPVSPARITIVTELANVFEFKKALKVKSIHDPKMSEHFSSTHYKDRTKAIVISTIEELRRLFPELKRTKFVIHDCSDPSLKPNAPHDRFIGFDNATSLISSSGFSIELNSQGEPDIWSDLEQMAKNLSNLDLLNNTKLPNPTYLVPVRTAAILPVRSRIITIHER